jgi:sortase A
MLGGAKRVMATISGESTLQMGVGPATRRRRLFWTLGNLMLVSGLYLLLYVGGLYAQAEYFVMAARGDSEIEAPRALMGERDGTPDFVAPVAPSAESAAAEPGMPAFEAPVLNGEARAAAAAVAAPETKVERLMLPSVKLDAKVIEVGWEVVEQDGQRLAVWEVAEYAVGQHRGSANPGEGGNVVLAGHVGGFGQVFRDLYYVLPGDPVVLYSEGRQFQYTVSERLIVDEEGAPPEQRAANAALIAPTDSEVVTMVTCWPPTGPDKFKQRVIIRAVPFAASAPPVADVAPQTVR